MRLETAPRLFAVIAMSALGCLSMQAGAQLAVQNQGYLPYSEAPINYRLAALSDPVAKLQQRLDQGHVSLQFDSGDHGYLRSVLKLLDIPINSQTLVFSKTSFQYPKISPDHPRARRRYHQSRRRQLRRHSRAHAYCGGRRDRGDRRLAAQL